MDANKCEQLDKYLRDRDFDNYYIALLMNTSDPFIAKKLNNLLFGAVYLQEDNVREREILDNLNFENITPKLEKLNKAGNLEDTFLQLHYGLHEFIYSEPYEAISIKNSTNHFAQYFLGIIYSDFEFESTSQRYNNDIAKSLYYLSLAAYNGNEAARKKCMSNYYGYKKLTQENINVAHFLQLENFNKKINEIFVELDKLKQNFQNLREEIDMFPGLGKKFLEARNNFDSKRYKIEN